MNFEMVFFKIASLRGDLGNRPDLGPPLWGGGTALAVGEVRNSDVIEQYPKKMRTIWKIM